MSKAQGSQNSTSQGTAPGWLNSALESILSGVGGTPSLGSLYNNPPVLGTSPGTYTGIAGEQGLARGTGFNSTMNTASGDLQNYIGTPGTPSAATKAGLNEFNTLQAPGILNNAASMGLGNSGAALEALQEGQTNALVPLLQSDQANSLSATNSLANLGQQGYQNKQGAIANSLVSSNIPNQNLFNSQQEQFGLGTSTDQQLLSMLQGLFGNKSSGGSSSTGFDLGSFF